MTDDTRKTYAATVSVRESILPETKSGKPWIIVEVDIDAVAEFGSPISVFINDLSGRAVRFDGRI